MLFCIIKISLFSLRRLFFGNYYLYFHTFIHLLFNNNKKVNQFSFSMLTLILPVVFFFFFFVFYSDQTTYENAKRLTTVQKTNKNEHLCIGIYRENTHSLGIRLRKRKLTKFDENRHFE